MNLSERNLDIRKPDCLGMPSHCDRVVTPYDLLQASINVQRLKPYYPETWRCSCWPVDNPAGTFIAMRSLQKPPRDVALSPTGIK